jgi:alanine racemase
MRPTRAEIDLGAIAHNVERLMALCPSSEFCAIVKADAYGHGAVPVAEVALGAGATRLGVALVDEGLELRQAGIIAPILLLSEPRPDEMDEVVEHELTPSVYSPQGIDAAAAAAERAGVVIPVHLNVDTGMHRVGAHPDDAVTLSDRIAGRPSLYLEGVYSHCAVADDPANAFTGVQLDRFNEVLGALSDAGHRPECRHFANSAAALSSESTHFDLIRVGIAMYGVGPSRETPGTAQLRPVMSLTTKVSFVKQLPAGASVSYGQRWTASEDTTIATLPVGYADGLRRSLSDNGGEVLINGRRLPIVGSVTMDQIMVDCGTDSNVAAGDAVVLMGTQGEHEISATDIADTLGTIPYEVVCDVTPRLRRRYRTTT